MLQQGAPCAGVIADLCLVMALAGVYLQWEKLHIWISHCSHSARCERTPQVPSAQCELGRDASNLPLPLASPL